MSNPQAEGRRWFEALVDDITSKTRRIVKETVEKGEAITKHNIENSGTLKSGKRGRVETGEMRDAVSSEMLASTADEVVGRFGWKNGPSYAKYQEGGFRHSSGVPVEGMFALHDAANEVLDDLREDLGDVI